MRSPTSSPHASRTCLCHVLKRFCQNLTMRWLFDTFPRQSVMSPDHFWNNVARLETKFVKSTPVIWQIASNICAICARRLSTRMVIVTSIFFASAT